MTESDAEVGEMSVVRGGGGEIDEGVLSYLWTVQSL